MVGKTEGDIQVFKKGGIPSAYMWKGAENKWEYVGEVVDPNAGAGGGQNMGMVEKAKHYPGDALFPEGDYDHVFDVELGDDIMRKLPFNNGENAISIKIEDGDGLHELIIYDWDILIDSRNTFTMQIRFDNPGEVGQDYSLEVRLILF